MKVTIYMRIARNNQGKPKVEAATMPNCRPLEDSNRYALPTAMFGVAFEIPEELFYSAARKIAEITVPEERATAVVRLLDGDEQG